MEDRKRRTADHLRKEAKNIKIEQNFDCQEDFCTKSGFKGDKFGKYKDIQKKKRKQMTEV